MGKSLRFPNPLLENICPMLGRDHDAHKPRLHTILNQLATSYKSELWIPPNGMRISRAHSATHPTQAHPIHSPISQATNHPHARAQSNSPTTPRLPPTSSGPRPSHPTNPLWHNIPLFKHFGPLVAQFSKCSLPHINTHIKSVSQHSTTLFRQRFRIYAWQILRAFGDHPTASKSINSTRMDSFSILITFGNYRSIDPTIEHWAFRLIINPRWIH